MNMPSLKQMLCLLYFSIEAIHTETKSWTINVASPIKGLPGSCVVIPCTFNFPNQNKNPTVFTGMWKDDRNQLIYHTNKPQIKQTYQNRTKLLGDLSQKNCSLEINPLEPNDQGPFHFRIEIANLNKYSYVRNTVSISMISELSPISLSVEGELREDRTAMACCSVNHSCPTSPPVFTWSHPGLTDVQHTPLEGGQWRTTSRLSFQPSRGDQNKNLGCSVRYEGGQQQQQQTTSPLGVSYLPEIRNVSHCASRAKEITCVCVVESNPPSGVQFVLSDNILDSTNVKTNGTVTTAILRVEQGPHGLIHCLANNTLGKANVILSITRLDKPNLYIIIAVGGVGLLLIFFLATLAVKKCVLKRGRTEAAQASRLKSDNAVALPQYAATRRMKRKEDTVEENGGQSFVDHVYCNMQTHEPIYANI